jgi:hypothetical protein
VPTSTSCCFSPSTSPAPPPKTVPSRTSPSTSRCRRSVRSHDAAFPSSPYASTRFRGTTPSSAQHPATTTHAQPVCACPRRHHQGQPQQPTTPPPFDRGRTSIHPSATCLKECANSKTVAVFFLRFRFDFSQYGVLF